MRKRYSFITLLAAVSISECIDWASQHGQKPNKLYCSSTEIKNCTTQEHRRREQPCVVDEHQSRPWISEIFHETEKQFAIHFDATEKCKRDFNHYKLHLANHSLWAVRMFESSEWPKIGILRARTPAFGHFTECTSIGVYGINGQYCMVENILDFDDFRDTRPKHTLDRPNEEASAWAAIQMYKYDKNRKYRNKFTWALCVPSTCTSADLNLSLRHAFREVSVKYSLRIATNVRQSWCKTRTIKTSVGYYVVKYFIILLAVIVLLASICVHRFDNTSDQRVKRNIITCFSIQKSYHTLVKFTPEREYMLIHLFKVFFAAMMVFLHFVLLKDHKEYYDADAVEELHHYTVNRRIATNSPEFGSIFIFFNGILLYQDFEKSSKIDLVQVLRKILKRWLRLFPPLFIVICFYTYFLPVLNNGPLWHGLQRETSYCLNNNLLPTLLTLPSARNKDMCYPVSWQAAVEFQLYAFNYACLAIARYYKKSHANVLLCLTLASSIWTFYTIYDNDQRVAQFSDMRYNHILDRTDKSFVYTVFMSTVTRFGCHAIGILVATMASKLREKTYTISKMQQIWGWCAVIIIHYIIAKFTLYLYELNYVERSFLGHLMKAVYGVMYYNVKILPFAYFFFIHLVNKFEYLEKSVPKGVVILNRLSYGVYICNFMVIQYRMFSPHTHTHSNGTLFSLVFSSMPDILYSLLVSIPFYFMVDAPIQNLVALFFYGSTKSTNSAQ